MVAVAVLGGGILGCLSALLVARDGVPVVLFEREDELWSGASATNEGKIHLGPVFALAGQRTHEVLLRSALSFAEIVEDAVGATVDWEDLGGDEFDYLVMPDSLLGDEELGLVYARLTDSIPDGARYLGRPLERVASSRSHRDVDTGLACFPTSERAVDPRRLGAVVTTALERHPLIDVRTASAVQALRPGAHGGIVIASNSAPDGETFDFAVNCTWTQQQSLLAAPHRRELNYRVKAAVRLAPFRGARTVTLVQGPYGDVVRHDDHVYASWYPDARLSNEFGFSPSATASARQRNAHGDLALGARQVEALRSIGLLPDAVVLDSVISGFIVGHGAIDIDSPSSLLHERGEFGVSVHDGALLTPQNFKFTSAPLAARSAAALLAELVGATAR